MLVWYRSLALVVPILAASCATDASSSSSQARDLQPDVQAISFLGEALRAPPMGDEERASKEADLAQAEAALANCPNDPDAWVWCGRRLAYLGRFREAVKLYSQALGRFPGDARLWRHRGHRRITLRMPELAVADLKRAAELAAGRPDEPEPGAKPSIGGVVIDTLQQNIYYHLGLAYYLQGDFRSAQGAFRECLKRSTHPDSLCSATHWLYMTLRRLGRDEEASKLLEPIRADLDVVEYHAYHRLCLMYKGELDPERLLAWPEPTGQSGVDFATIAYGVGNWYLCNGHPERALEIFRRAAGVEMWPAFGRIAAEVELADAGVAR